MDDCFEGPLPEPPEELRAFAAARRGLDATLRRVDELLKDPQRTSFADAPPPAEPTRESRRSHSPAAADDASAASAAERLLPAVMIDAKAAADPTTATALPTEPLADADSAAQFDRELRVAALREMQQRWAQSAPPHLVAQASSSSPAALALGPAAAAPDIQQPPSQQSLEAQRPRLPSGLRPRPVPVPMTPPEVETRKSKRAHKRKRGQGEFLPSNLIDPVSGLVRFAPLKAQKRNFHRLVYGEGSVSSTIDWREAERQLAAAGSNTFAAAAHWLLLWLERGNWEWRTGSQLFANALQWCQASGLLAACGGDGGGGGERGAASNKGGVVNGKATVDHEQWVQRLIRWMHAAAPLAVVLAGDWVTAQQQAVAVAAITTDLPLLVQEAKAGSALAALYFGRVAGVRDSAALTKTARELLPAFTRAPFWHEGCRFVLWQLNDSKTSPELTDDAKRGYPPILTARYTFEDVPIAKLQPARRVISCADSENGIMTGY